MSVFSSAYVTDQFQAVGDGAMNAMSSTADVASYVVSKIGLRDYDPNEFTSQSSTVTHTADFVRPVTQFLAEMSMIGGSIKRVGQFGLGGFRAGRGLLNTAQGAVKGASVVRGAGTWAQSMAVASVAFDAKEPTLLFNKDADENFIVGRLKNAVDDGTAGFVLGKAVESVLKGVARVFKASVKGDTAGAEKFMNEARQAIEKSDAGQSFAKKVVGTGSKITEEQALESASKIAYGLHKASGGKMSVDEVFASVDVMKLSEMGDLLKRAGISADYAGDEVSAAAGKVLAEGGDEEAALAAALKELDTKAAAEPIALADAPAAKPEVDPSIPLAKDVRTRARRAATPAELATLLTMPLPPYRRLCYALAAMNGLRRNEIKELRRGDLDLTAEIPIVTLPKKASAGSDTIPVHPFVVRLLREQSLAMPGVNVVPFVPDVDTLKNDLAAAGIAFSNERGERLDMHALRHTFRTNLDRVKASRVTVKRLMRHAASDVTDNYAHADLSELADALSRLPSPDSINRAGTGAVATGTGLPLSTCDQIAVRGQKGGPSSRPSFASHPVTSGHNRKESRSDGVLAESVLKAGQVKRMTGFPGISQASPVPSLPVESLVSTLFAIRPSTQVV